MLNLILKPSPVGVDRVIDQIQKRLSLNLDFGNVLTEVYPRAYKNPKTNNITRLIPEIFIGNGDYKEVFFDDNLALMVYFLTDDKFEILKGGLISGEISIIVHANLVDLFNVESERKDEELHLMFINALKNWAYKPTSIETGIKNVYREFDISNVLLDDMSHQHVFRLNLSATWQNCCKNC